MSKRNERDNQLIDVGNYDVENMIFSDAVVGTVPNSALTFKRVNISTRNPDGSVGDLILPTERLFSFGVQENKDFNNPEKVNGYVLPLSLWGREGATPSQKVFTDLFDKIVEHTKDWIIDNKDVLEQYDLEKTALKKFNPLYWKREKGKIVEGTGPTLYPKLISSKKHAKKGENKEPQEKILSMFYTPSGVPIEPLTLLGRYCNVRAGIKIESIFIGSKITLQVKVYEAEVEPIEQAMKPLMKPRPSNGRLLETNSNATTMNDMVPDFERKDSTGSLKDDEHTTPPKTTVVKKKTTGKKK